MTDRYTNAVLTIIAVALIALVLEHQFMGAKVVSAQADRQPQHCVWTFITDQGRPNLGKNGAVDLSDLDWKRVSEEGWQLKAFAQNGTYVFERCQ